MGKKRTRSHQAHVRRRRRFADRKLVRRFVQSLQKAATEMTNA